MHKKAFTLFEIIVSLMILAICMIGLVNIFISGKTYIQRARSGMTGGEVGKFIIDPLQQEVRQDTWGTGGLGLGTHNLAPHNIGGKEYRVSYTVEDFPGRLLRRVIATIVWVRD